MVDATYNNNTSNPCFDLTTYSLTKRWSGNGFFKAPLRQKKRVTPGKRNPLTVWQTGKKQAGKPGEG